GSRPRRIGTRKSNPGPWRLRQRQELRNGSRQSWSDPGQSTEVATRTMTASRAPSALPSKAGVLVVSGGTHRVDGPESWTGSAEGLTVSPDQLGRPARPCRVRARPARPPPPGDAADYRRQPTLQERCPPQAGCGPLPVCALAPTHGTYCRA